MPGPRMRRRLLAGAMLAGWSAATPAAPGQAPPIVGPPPMVGPGPAVGGPNDRSGPIARAAHHVGSTLKDKLIGYPDQFPQPPVGYYVRENNVAQINRADTHRFTLYRTDFWSESDQLTPTGAARLARMVSRAQCWGGALLIEQVPDRPGLAERRREAISGALARANVPIGSDRVLVGLSPYNGLRGDLAGGPSVIGGYDGIVLQRSLEAGSSVNLPLPPAQDAQLSTGSGGGGGGGQP